MLLLVNRKFLVYLAFCFVLILIKKLILNACHHIRIDGPVWRFVSLCFSIEGQFTVGLPALSLCLGSWRFWSWRQSLDSRKQYVSDTEVLIIWQIPPLFSFISKLCCVLGVLGSPLITIERARSIPGLVKPWDKNSTYCSVRQVTAGPRAGYITPPSPRVSPGTQECHHGFQGGAVEVNGTRICSVRHRFRSW